MERHIQTFKDYKNNTVKEWAVECIIAQHLRTKRELRSQAASVDSLLLGNACWATVMIIPSFISTRCTKSHTGNSSIPLCWRFLRPAHAKQFRKRWKKQLWNILSVVFLNPNSWEFLVLPLALVFFNVYVWFVSFTLFSQFIQTSTLFWNSSDLLGLVMCAREELQQLIMPRVQKSVLDVFVFYFTSAVLCERVNREHPSIYCTFIIILYKILLYFCNTA